MRFDYRDGHYFIVNSLSADSGNGFKEVGLLYSCVAPGSGKPGDIVLHASGNAELIEVQYQRMCRRQGALVPGVIASIPRKQRTADGTELRLSEPYFVRSSTISAQDLNRVLADPNYIRTILVQEKHLAEQQAEWVRRILNEAVQLVAAIVIERMAITTDTLDPEYLRHALLRNVRHFGPCADPRNLRNALLSEIADVSEAAKRIQTLDMQITPGNRSGDLDPARLEKAMKGLVARIEDFDQSNTESPGQEELTQHALVAVAEFIRVIIERMPDKGDGAELSLREELLETLTGFESAVSAINALDFEGAHDSKETGSVRARRQQVLRDLRVSTRFITGRWDEPSGPTL